MPFTVGVAVWQWCFPCAVITTRSLPRSRFFFVWDFHSDTSPVQSSAVSQVQKHYSCATIRFRTKALARGFSGRSINGQNIRVNRTVLKKTKQKYKNKNKNSQTKYMSYKAFRVCANLRSLIVSCCRAMLGTVWGIHVFSPLLPLDPGLSQTK